MEAVNSISAFSEIPSGRGVTALKSYMPMDIKLYNAEYISQKF